MAVLSGRNFVLAAAFAGLFAAMPASADVNTDANALFVGAVQAWTAAAAIPTDDPAGAAERAELLETVNRNLDQIIDDLAGSDLAVRLITGETLGPITLHGARDALAQTNAAASGLECAAAPSPACLVQEALPDLANCLRRRQFVKTFEQLHHCRQVVPGAVIAAGGAASRAASVSTPAGIGSASRLAGPAVSHVSPPSTALDTAPSIVALDALGITIGS